MTDHSKAPRHSRVILTDIPSENDEFSGGGHQRTANALADTIVQFEGADRAIGLEGSWGSGKSTIVELAKKKLADTDRAHKYHVFTFDLWANQTGHFKRSFLEAFLSWSTDTFPSEARFLEEKKSQVGDRKQTVTTNNSRRFSWFGIAAIIFLYFSPLIYAWLTPAAFTNADGEPAVKVGVILSWVAIAVMAIVLLWAISAFWPDKGDRLAKLQHAVSKAFALFSKEADVTVIEQNIRDEDPTKFEFTKIFREIVAKLQQKNDRIVVVFDNIDRLPSDRIADQWSEVRSAFYGDHSGTVGKTEITAIVPYARAVTLAAVAVAKEANGRPEFIDADLFRKSFDAIFHVAPPILSDAATFFKSKFTEATKGQLDDQTASRVYRIFDLKVQTSGFPHTPRQVIAFINDVTSWWVQWNGEIPAETIAVFVAHQSQLVNQPGILRSEGAIDARMIRHANQKGLVRDLAALAYNVSPSMALQVLSHDAIRQALIAEQPERLRELVQGSPDNGFPDVLTQVVDEFAGEWAGESATVMAHVVSNIAAIEEPGNLFGYSKRVIQSHVTSFADASMSTIEKSEKVLDIVSFAAGDEVAKVATDLIAWINRALPQADKQEVSHGRQWIKIVGKLLDRVEHHHGRSALDAILPRVSLPAGPKAILGAGIDCDETSYHLRQFSSIAHLKSSIAGALTEIAKDDQLFHYAWNELNHLFGDKEKIDLLAIPIDFLKTNVVEAGSDQLDYALRNISDIYPTISAAVRAKEKLAQELFESGAAMHYANAIQQSSGGTESKTLTILFWLSMEEFGPERSSIPNVQAVPTFGNIQAAFNWFYGQLEAEEFPDARCTEIAKLAVKSGRFTHYINGATKDSAQQDMFVSILRKLVEDEGFRPPSFNVFVQHFTSLKANLGEGIEALYAAIGKKHSDDYWSKIAFDELPTPLVSNAAQRNEQGWKILLQKLDDWLRKLDADEWRQAIAASSNAVSLLQQRGRDSSLKVPVANLYEPLLGNALSILSGSEKSLLKSAAFQQMVECLPDNSQTQFPIDLFKRHDAYSKGIAEALSTFGPLIAKMPFETNPNKAVDGYLLPLLKENSVASDEFVINNKKLFRQILKNADTTKRGLVSEFLDEPQEGNGKSERNQKLRESLGLPVTSAVPERKKNDSQDV